jgi:transposase-like protein
MPTRMAQCRSSPMIPSPLRQVVSDYARRLKRKKPGRRDVWHLDEVVVSTNGETRYLWRAVD